MTPTPAVPSQSRTALVLRGDHAVVAPPERLDEHAVDHVTDAATAARQVARTVWVDLRAVTSLGTEAAWRLVQASRTHDLRLVAPQSAVAATIVAVGGHPVLWHVPELDDEVRALLDHRPASTPSAVPAGSDAIEADLRSLGTGLATDLASA